ncbi:MAG: pyridoxamine 5'-phosphate oxidase family protein [Rubritepida sp.]|nr:pyridoxamine 5'-phosphate oxidase family protein [Rubritepida sp.]
MSDPHAVTSLAALEALYAAPSELVKNKATNRVDARTAAFIAASPFLLLGTSGARGIHVTPRGDAPGFVTVADERTLILPDRRGNNRLDALRDILEDDRVSLLFLVPGVGETLRVHGTARITTDPALRAAHVAQCKEPATLLVIAVRELFMQCAKALMRSRLWVGQERPRAVPSMGELLESQTPGRVTAAEVDASYPERMRTTMY